MLGSLTIRRRAALGAVATGAVLMVQVAGALTVHAATGYNQSNLVSDIPGMAAITDSRLVNPWGIAATSVSPLAVANAGTGHVAAYTAAPQNLAIDIVVPPAPPATTSSPTGINFNPGAGFIVSQGGKSGPAIVILVGEDGGVTAWNPNVSSSALLMVNNSATAVYKGAAVGHNAGGDFLFAANFKSGKVDVFNSSFQPATLAGSFSDPSLPAGFAPFNIVSPLAGLLVVLYASTVSPGVGMGAVDVFDTNGNLLLKFLSGGVLNEPWGFAVAPSGFGQFAGDILIGNFGDGLIHAYTFSGTLAGTITNSAGQPLVFPGLWALQIGTGGVSGGANKLFITAGIQNEAHGLLAALTPA